MAAQEFSSIEEYIGRNQAEYYEVLADAGHGGFHPERHPQRWIRFCLKGHYMQLQTILRRNQEFGIIYGDLVDLLRESGLHERMALALLEAAFGRRVRNASYRVSADISNNLASRDLKQLLDLGLLEAQGEKRGRHYLAGPVVREIRQRRRVSKEIKDPFEQAAEQEGQAILV
jgi:Fic family protein